MFARKVRLFLCPRWVDTTRKQHPQQLLQPGFNPLLGFSASSCCHSTSSANEDTDHLLVKRTGPCKVLTLNRPGKRNALSPAIVDRMLGVVEESSEDGTRLFVIRGEGKAMCSGFDFTGLKDQTDADLTLRFVRLELLLQAVHHAPFATIALVQGGCYGAGADLVAACGSRVACPISTSFRMPGLNFGIVLGSKRLANITGTDNARRLLETTKVFKAQEALKCGFATTLAAPEDWPGIVDRATVAATSLPIAAQRAMLKQTQGPDTRDGDLAALVRSASSPGLKERIEGFVAMRSAPPPR
jgi:enoyl-CoA hydratase/carnithine racemase